MSSFDCIIVGGGFTGLSACYDLVAKGKTVLVLESDDSLGGLAGGFDVGGYELEKFYHHWFTNDHYISDLVEEIGQQDRILMRPSNTGMYFSGNIYRLSTPLDLLKFDALPFADRIRTGIATLALRRIADWKPLEHLTASEWLKKYFGETSYSVLWEPLLVGKFGEYAEDVSAVWFWKKLALRGSSRGKGGAEYLAYYRGGFAKLAQDIGEKIEAGGGKILTSTKAKSISSLESGEVSVTTEKGAFTAKSVLITTPFPIAADLLREAAPAEYVQSLERVNYLSNVCLVLDLDRSLSNTYWLNVNDPSFPFVGIIEHTNFEPTESYGGRNIVYLSRYLTKSDPLYSMSSKEMLEFSIPHIKRMFPEFDPSWIQSLHLWRADHAQHIVEKHYSTYVPPFETPLTNVFISTMAQIYPEDRGTNYAVREGRKAAVRIQALL